jgi:hypothetical protein
VVVVVVADGGLATGVLVTNGVPLRSSATPIATAAQQLLLLSLLV